MTNSREERIRYYKNVVKRYLNNVLDRKAEAKNTMERDYYNGRYIAQLGIFAEALNVREKDLKQAVEARHK